MSDFTEHAGLWGIQHENGVWHELIATCKDCSLTHRVDVMSWTKKFGLFPHRYVVGATSE